MLLLLGIWIFYSAPSGLSIMCFALIPVFAQKMVYPIAAVFPFETSTFATYFPVYLYQMIGIGIGAASNIATDTCGVALLLHVRAQIDRLGLQLSKVPLKGGNLGHFSPGFQKSILQIGYFDKKAENLMENLPSTSDGRTRALEQAKQKINLELKRCVLFHRELLKLNFFI